MLITKSNCSRFFFSIDNSICKAFANFEKLKRFHWQAFMVYNNGENLKMLIEIINQKIIVSSVILAFLDHLKAKIFFVGQAQWPTQSHPFSKSLDPPLTSILLLCHSKEPFVHSNQVSTCILLPSSRNSFDIIFTKLSALTRNLLQTRTIRRY